MKKLVYCLLLAIPFYFVIQGCNKLTAVSSGNIKASKITLKINEPDSLLLDGAKTTDVVTWTVTPPGFDTLATKSNVARIVFTKSGTYTVKAEVAGQAAQTISITVTNDVYNNTSPNTTATLTGDLIKLTPSVYKSSKGDTSYIAIKATTTKSYCGAARLNVSSSVDAANNYAINFVNVTQSVYCTGSVPLNAYINLKQTPAVLANGTYPLTATLNGTTYSGTVVVTTSNITFNWSYTSGVTITPTQLSR